MCFYLRTIIEFEIVYTNLFMDMYSFLVINPSMTYVNMYYNGCHPVTRTGSTHGWNVTSPTNCPFGGAGELLDLFCKGEEGKNPQHVFLGVLNKKGFCLDGIVFLKKNSFFEKWHVS